MLEIEKSSYLEYRDEGKRETLKYILSLLEQLKGDE
jgi:hypothetical protein